MSPIVEVLRHIAGFPANCPDLWWNGVAVFSYRDDFGRLWGIDDTGVDDSKGGVDRFIARLIDHRNSLSGEDRQLTAVIVQDGAPPGDTTAHRLVAPGDWAMLVAGAIYGRCPGLKGAFPGTSLATVKLRIWMVDVECLADATQQAAPHLQELQKSLPGIRTFRGDGLRSFVDQLPNLHIPHPTMDAENDNVGGERIGSARDLWLANVLRHEDRHSVANLMAPLILADELGASRFVAVSQPERALMAAFRAVAPGSEDRETGPGAPLLASSRGRRGEAKFLLVDDRFELGYHHVVAVALFGDEYDPSDAAPRPWRYSRSGGSLECHAKIDWLVEQVARFGAIRNWASPRRLSAERCDVLLLDLRFWEQRRMDERREEMQKVLGAAGSCGLAEWAADDAADDRCVSTKSGEALNEALSKAGILARSTADPEDADGTGTRAEAGTADPEAPALALLPLMVSFIDPTLPIVVFSSTRQRVVSEMLRNRPNIITDFAKPAPNLAGDREGRFLQSAKALTGALDKALDLHERRVVWERLSSLTPRESTTDFGWRGRYGTGIYAKLAEADLPQLADVVGRFTLGEITVYESLYRPWSFLENRVRQENPQPEAELWISPTGRGRLARALREIGENMYGSLDPGGFKDNDTHAQSVAILQFLFLLDFLAGARRRTDWVPGRPKTCGRRDWTAVRHALGRYGRPENGETFLNAETETIVRRLCYEGE